MMAPNSIVKKTAREALSECFLQSVATGCVLIFSIFVMMLAGSIVSVFAGTVGYFITEVLLVIFVMYPLFLGVLTFFRRILWGQIDGVVSIFKYFSSLDEYKRALGLALYLAKRFALASAIIFSPCFVVWVFSNETVYSWFDMALPVWASNLWTLNSFFVIIGVFLLCFVMLKYYLAPFLFISNDNITVADAINMSVTISKRTGGDFFGLFISFIGLILLSVLVAPLIFTTPYFLTAYCVHSQFSVSAYNRDVDIFNANSAPSFSIEEI